MGAVYLYLPANGMIRFFIVINTRGMTRLSKFYVPQTEEQKLQIKQQVQDIVTKNLEKKGTNIAPYGTGRLLFRRYQQLFFCVCTDEDDNELACFEAIHLYVTVLNAYFNPVTEQNIMFNFHKCYIILDEVLLAGEVMETSKAVIMQQIAGMDS